MTDFIEIPASKRSISKRAPVCGVGINDAWYLVNNHSNGVYLRCPYYAAWKGMITRSYSSEEHKRRPGYKGCSVVSEWRRFSIFRRWMESQDWKGKHLDKDLLVSGNKIYGPEFCMFVSPQINTLLCGCDAIRGDLPKGVSYKKSRGKYQAYCSSKGKRKSLGCFDSVDEAEYAYCIFKSDLIINASKETEAENNLKVKGALIMNAKSLQERARLIKLKIWGCQ